MHTDAGLDRDAASMSCTRATPIPVGALFGLMSMPHASWGDALLATGQPDAAIGKYQAAIAENLHTAMAWRGWGMALAKLGRNAEAQEKLERAAREDPYDPAIFRTWAAVLEALGRTDEARSKRAEATRLDQRIAAYAEKAAKG
jgi:tetratricopeptide (TPR) repeat protein